MKTLVSYLHRERGQTMTEYGTVLTVITIAALSAFTLLGGSVINAIARVGGLLG